MRRNRSLGLIVLAVYLILVGISGLGLFSFAGMETLTAICALAAGIMLLINRWQPDISTDSLPQRGGCRVSQTLP